MDGKFIILENDCLNSSLYFMKELFQTIEGDLLMKSLVWNFIKRLKKQKEDALENAFAQR